MAGVQSTIAQHAVCSFRTLSSWVLQVLLDLVLGSLRYLHLEIAFVLKKGAPPHLARTRWLHILDVDLGSIVDLPLAQLRPLL